jgi:hypothetical protein
MRFQVSCFVFSILVLAPGPVLAEQERGSGTEISRVGMKNAADEDPLLTRIKHLVESTRTATWTQTTWETDGEKEESTAAHCMWAGQDRQRLDVFDGRGKGATAILFEGRVHGFKRGLLSFIKKSFDPDHERVVSLRGNSMLANGFIDDLQWLSDHWGTVFVARDSVGTVLTVEEAAVTRRFHLGEDPLRVILEEAFEGDRLVERYTYEDVSYNPDLDWNRMKP